MSRFRTLAPPDEGREVDASPRRAVVDVLVEANACPAIEYRLQAGRRPRLAKVHLPAGEDLPGDVGQVAESADADGQPLRAIVVSEVSAHPGAVVPGHVVGLVQPEGGERAWVVIVPVDDPASADVRTPTDLPEALQRRLGTFLGADRLTWTGPEDAERLARSAVERGRRRQAEQRAERAAAEAAWSPTPGTERRWATYEGETHTEAELNLFRVPYQFQLYLREVLLPQERLLATVHRPALALGRWPLGRQTEPEAMLVLTDHQLLVLSDARPADGQLFLGGFVARATAVERIARVELEATGEHTALRAELLSMAGRSPWTILAPRDSTAERLAILAARFCSRPDETLLARRGHVEPVTVDATGWQVFFDDDAREAWHGRLMSALASDELLLAWALTPEMPADNSPAAAVALTSMRLVVVGERGCLASWPMGALASVELRSSPFASAFRAWTAGTAPALTLPFPYTVGPAFLDLYLAIRRRLAAFPLDGRSEGC